MIVRALTSKGDFTFGAGKNNYLVGRVAVGQAIATNLMMFLGDCFWATNTGLDWWTFLGGSKAQLSLQLAINATILNTQSNGVNVITNLNAAVVSLNTVTRQFSVTYDVTTIFGNIQSVVNINLGVGPLAPPAITPLLPQFNQTLLNNISATAITNAAFNSTAWWEVDLDYYIERRDSASSYNQRGILICKFDPKTSLWSIDNTVLSGSSGPTTGVTFSINSSTGQVYYASDNMTGSGYVGNLIIESDETFVAGL
jgi:hypothetical protein